MLPVTQQNTSMSQTPPAQKVVGTGAIKSNIPVMVPNENFIFCPPLPGEPDYSVPLQNGKHLRKKFDGARTNACFDFAIKILCDWKVPEEGKSEEKLYSERQKTISLLYKTIFYAKGVAKNYQEDGSVLDNVSASKIADMKPIFSVKEGEDLYGEKVRNLFKCFSLQQKPFLDFCNELGPKSSIDLDKQIIFKLGGSQEIIENIVQERYPSSRWETLDLYQQQELLYALIQYGQALVHGAKKSEWHPLKPVEDLMKQLKLFGPHMIGGHIGKAYYDGQLREQAVVEGRTIYCWSNSKPIETSEAHAVIIVGAQILKGKGFVYFMDPVDASDPQDLSSQKIYVISYERLKGGIIDLAGNRYRFEKMPNSYQLPNNFAYHM